MRSGNQRSSLAGSRMAAQTLGDCAIRHNTNVYCRLTEINFLKRNSTIKKKKSAKMVHAAMTRKNSSGYFHPKKKIGPYVKF